MTEDLQDPASHGMDRWSAFVRGRPEAERSNLDAVSAEFECAIAELTSASQNPDEAFLVALKRLAERDPAVRAFALEYATELWAPPAETPAEPPAQTTPAVSSRASFLVMLGCSVAAAIAIKAPTLIGYSLERSSTFYVMNIGYLLLPFLLIFVAWEYRPPTAHLVAIAGVLAVGAACANSYPFASEASTRLLTALHLPVVSWLALGVAMTAGAWRSVARRMEFVRFTGEWFITLVLIVLGGAVLTSVTVASFAAMGLGDGNTIAEWMVPCGGAAAVVVAAWLVVSRRTLLGGLAPMLARVFTPLFAGMLAVLLVAVIWTRGFLHVEREALILLDGLLVLVVALLLYGISSRERDAKPGMFDRLQFGLVACALAVDLFTLTGIAIRLSEFGFSANRAAALGLNLILLVNLSWSAYLQTRFVAGLQELGDVERWQMSYLPVYAIWAAIVAVVFPLVFRFA